jgi:hypothetical protein
MSETDETAEKHFLDHPEVNELFDSAINSVVGESDRGAVLVAAAYVDMHLRRLFEQLAPDDMSRRRLKEILDYPGTLSSLASRADVAYVTRLIGKSLYEAIGHLRRIRNAVVIVPIAFV